MYQSFFFVYVAHLFVNKIADMPKYGKKRGYSKKRPASSKLDRAYKKVVAKKTTKKKKRVVAKAKQIRLASTPYLRQPVSTLVKFQANRCETYKMSDLYPQAYSGSIGYADTEQAFPIAGINIMLNDIWDPFDYATASSTPQHCAGFDDISRQYSKYRVVGSKVTIKFRRLGGSIPMGNALHNGHQLVEPQNSTGVQSDASALGGIFDPSNLDPLMIIAVDRAAYQDQNSQINEVSLNTYEMVHRFSDIKGVKWRELKAGPAQSTSMTHKWSERRFEGGPGHNNDHKQANTGTFQTADSNGTFSGGGSPLTPDKLNINIKPFDQTTNNHQAFTRARILMTIHVDYVVKCFEQKASYQRLH